MEVGWMDEGGEVKDKAGEVIGWGERGGVGVEFGKDNNCKGREEESILELKVPSDGVETVSHSVDKVVEGEIKLVDKNLNGKILS